MYVHSRVCTYCVHTTTGLHSIHKYGNSVIPCGNSIVSDNLGPGEKALPHFLTKLSLCVLRTYLGGHVLVKSGFEHAESAPSHVARDAKFLARAKLIESGWTQRKFPTQKIALLEEGMWGCTQVFHT